MLVGIDYGRKRLDFEIRDDAFVGSHRKDHSLPITDLGAAIRQALESPLEFPALNRALTPDDHVAIVLDDELRQASVILVPVLEHIAAARVKPDQVTILRQFPFDTREWPNGVPESLRGVQIEVHDPTNRKKLSYLATTKRGRRIYLNRTIVDADQLVVLSRRRYDPLLGYAGAEGALYPAMSDDSTREDLYSHMSLAAPADKPWPTRKEASEVAWLLGAPFLVQIIEGPGEQIVHIIGGTTDSGDEGIHLLNANWRVTVDSQADAVVAGISGDPSSHTFADLAAAFACAARVVKPQGRIILLSEASPALGAGMELLRQANDLDQGCKLLRQKPPSDMAAAFLWASAAKRASLYLLSRLPAEVADELFVTPLENGDQVQRLLNAPGTRLFLSDAHKTLAIPSSGNSG